MQIRPVRTATIAGEDPPLPSGQPFFSGACAHISVDPALRRKLGEKMQETVERGAEIRAMANKLSSGSTEDFVAGVIAGRLYNSFYYQCRRIKKRNPKPGEMEEFLSVMADEWDRMVDACGRTTPE